MFDRLQEVLPKDFNVLSQTRPLFVYFRPCLSTMTNLTINGRSIDSVLGIRTRDRGMVCVDESTELLQLQKNIFLFRKWQRLKKDKI